MTPEVETSRIDLRYASLCMELDCNTVFDSVRYRHCPTCGSVEFYPLESWLNRDRSASRFREEWIEAIPSLWGERRSARGTAAAPAGARDRAARRRAG